MTISHPAKVKNILASGIDKLVISMDLEWKDESIFTVLDEYKNKAIEFSIDFPGNIKHFKHEEVFPFTIKPHGTKGFSWILTAADFTYPRWPPKIPHLWPLENPPPNGCF